MRPGAERPGGRSGDTRAPSALPCAGPGRTVVLRLLRRRGLAHLHPEDAQEEEQQPQAGPEQEPGQAAFQPPPRLGPKEMFYFLENSASPIISILNISSLSSGIHQ